MDDCICSNNLSSELSFEEFEVSFKSIKKNKAPGADEINGNIVLECFEHLKGILFKVFRASIQQGVFPDNGYSYSGYENLLRLNLPYPSLRTLRQRLENLKFQSGILTEVFEFMKTKVNAMKIHEKECVLILVEMSITESVDCDTSTSSYYGVVTLPEHYGQANHALVFMLGGISTRWKQTVAYYYTGSSVLKIIVLSIIKYTEEIGLKVNSVTSDMGAINQAMWKCFNISSKIQKKYKVQSPIIDSKHLNKLVDFQEGMDLKFAYKLTSEHLDEKHFNKMKVSRATFVMNHDVSCGLKFIASEIKDDSILTTARFIGIVDKWFTLMTSRNPGMALSMKNDKVYNETITFLNEVIEIFNGLKILGQTEKIRWKPIQSGVILSTTSVINLQNKFLLEKKFDFLMTSRFTQDCLENLFSLVRAKQVIPTALQFKNNMKLICVAQFLKKSSKGSYDIDDRQFLSGFLDIVNSNVHKPQQRECIFFT
ncbi:uncharacterized protein LOC136073890 [Hydra vulgaris]|uniref:uncharacterized protein LOC136073890 n=1 Tax=Hydra vulgaris TaxID=6087 RepID=UPI0032EA8AED